MAARDFWTVPRLAMLGVISSIAAFVNFGIYGRIVADSAAAQSAAAWWAAPDSLTGRLLFILLATLFIYYVLLQNVVGSAIALFFWKQRKKLRIRADLSRAVEHYGWGPVRSLASTVRWSVILNTLCVTLLLHAFLDWGTALLLLPFGISFVYLALPYVLVSNRLRSFRQEQGRLIDERSRDCDIYRSAGPLNQLRMLVHDANISHTLGYGKFTAFCMSSVFASLVSILIDIGLGE